MRLRSRNRRNARRGAAAVEAACILPVAFLLIIGLIIAILGVFRFNQIASLASEGARWAVVHGKNYEDRKGSARLTAEDVLRTVIRPRAAGLDLNALTCDLTWSPNQSVVSVKVSYQWLPEAYFGSRVMSC